MKFKIREACVNDSDDIYVINRDSLGYDYPPERTMQKLADALSSNKDKIFVAVVEDGIAGYIHLTDYDVIYAPHFKNILGLAVLEKFKRFGIGSALLAEGEKWAKQTGAAGVRLCSGESRTDAHQFYRSCGYKDNKKQLNFKKLF